MFLSDHTSALQEPHARFYVLSAEPKLPIATSQVGAQPIGLLFRQSLSISRSRVQGSSSAEHLLFLYLEYRLVK
jgi:hypothetical protein